MRSFSWPENHELPDKEFNESPIQGPLSHWDTFHCEISESQRTRRLRCSSPWAVHLMVQAPPGLTASGREAVWLLGSRERSIWELLDPQPVSLLSALLPNPASCTPCISLMIGVWRSSLLPGLPLFLHQSLPCSLDVRGFCSVALVIINKHEVGIFHLLTSFVSILSVPEDFCCFLPISSQAFQ